MRTKRASAVLAFLVLGMGGARAEPADGGKLTDPSTLYPKGTVATVRTAPVGTLQENIDAFGNACLGMVWMMAGGEVQGFFMSPIGQALDPERPVGVALLPPGRPGAEPRAYVYYPETAPGALAAAVKQAKADAAQTGMPVSGIGASLMTAELKSLPGGYAVAGLPGTLDAAAPGGAAWPVVSSGLVVLSADVAQIQQAFAQEIEMGFAQMAKAASQGMAPGQEKMAVFLVELYRSLLRQSSRLEAALDLSEKGAALSFNLTPKKGSTIDKFVTAQTPGIPKSPLGAVAGKDAWAVAEYAWDASVCAKTFASLVSRAFAASGVALDPDTKRAQAEFFSGASTSAVAYRSTPTALMECAGVVACATPAAAARLADIVRRFTTVPATPGVSYRPKIVTAKVPVQSYEMVFDAKGIPPEQAVALEMTRAFYGKGALLTLSQSGPEVAMGIGPESVRRVEEMVAARAAGQAGTPPAWYGKLAPALPGDAQTRAGFSLIGILRLAGRAMEAQGQPNPMAMVEKMALADSGIGVYGRSAKGTLSLGLVIPAETFGLAQQLMMPLMGAMMHAQPVEGPDFERELQEDLEREGIERGE